MQQVETGAILNGKVSGTTRFGVFVDLGDGKTGMVHISEVASTFVENISDFITVGQEVKVKVLGIGEDGKISLSIKRAQEREQRERRPAPRKPVAPPDRPTGGEWVERRSDNLSFEDMMSKFKQTSDDKMSDLKRKNNGEVRRTKRVQK
ncbi:MAG: S1 RNA-binding domain-containing protein [Clostridia bacterium]|nr:S1 RNA-binding domain-containing protein [Clostridia bacterium]